MNHVGEGNEYPLGRGEVTAEKGRCDMLCAEVNNTSAFCRTRYRWQRGQRAVPLGVRCSQQSAVEARID